jgi:cysteine-rich repeat protein
MGNYALCCLPTGSCGDGMINSAEEECDDGNMSDGDNCFTTCMTKTSNGMYCN